MRVCIPSWAWWDIVRRTDGEEHFEFVHYNVSADDMNNNKVKCVKFGRLV
jgi:hypothetical protein